MKRLMGRLLAAVLTAIIIFSSAASGAAAQAQHAETGMSAGVLTVSAGSVHPDPETDESRAGGERPEKGAGRRDAERGAEEAAAEDEEENSSGEDADAVSRSDEGTADAERGERFHPFLLRFDRGYLKQTKEQNRSQLPGS